jgi:hypothetical protein
MKQKVLLSLAAVALVVLPVSTIAATYGYVNNQGTISLIEAPSAQEALAIAPNIDAHSGVILMKPGITLGLKVTPSVGTTTTATSTLMMSATSTTSVASTTVATTTATSTATTTVR